MRIKRIKLYLGALAFGFLSCATAIAHDDGDGKEKHTPMGEQMEIVSKRLKLLRTMERGDYTAGAKAVREAHGALLKAMAFIPALIKEMQDDLDKQIAIADSRALMGHTYGILCELEIAYLKKDDKQIEALAKKWKALKKDGHKKYTDD